MIALRKHCKDIRQLLRVTATKDFSSFSKEHRNPKSSGNQQHDKTNKGVSFLKSLRETLRVESIPTTAFGLGLAGAVPFVLLTPPISHILPESMFSQPVEAQANYGAAILSFLGGPHWGLAMVRTHAPPNDKVFFINISTFRFIWSIVPPLLAWAALLLPEISKMTMLIVSFSLALAFDAWCTLHGLLPQWYLPLRSLLSLIVILCLMSSALHLYFKSKMITHNTPKD